MKKAFRIIAAVLFFLLLAAYGLGCWFFQSHFYYGTYIDGTLFGCMDAVQVRQELVNHYKDYELTVIGRYEIMDTLSGETAGCVLEPEAELQDILGRQRWWLWFLSFFESHVYTLTDSVQIDEEVFAEAADGLSIFAPENIVEPEDARLSEYSSLKKGYEIIEEVEGSRIHVDEAVEAIRSALQIQQAELNLTGEEYYDQPEIRSDDETLTQAVEQRNAYTEMKFTYNMHGIEVVVDGDDIHEWLVDEDGQVSVDEELVCAFVQELADTYDTYGKTRSFTTVDGRELELRSGAYGWKMDVETEQQALLNMLSVGGNIYHSPTWLKEGYVEGEDDIGDTYVEIDLGAQHLYVIVGGEIVLESDCVSGNVSNGHTTPSGVFGITYKTRNAVLRGADYATPVSYWMPFNHNIGMHDATWRSSFGGTIYKTNGSHGCINLPLSKAKEIYDLVETNMPVVCYY